MTTILIASVPVHGHVAPLLPIAQSYAASGADVVFLTGARFADAVNATGAQHVALPAAADFDDRTVTSRFPERDQLSPVKAIAFDFEHIFVRPGEHQYTAVRDILARGRVDALVCDPLFFGGALLTELPAAERVPVVVAGVVPLNMPGPGLAPFGMGLAPRGGLGGGIRNAALRAGTRRLFRTVDAAADEIAMRLHGHALRGPILDWLPRADAVAQLTVASFEYPRPGAAPSLVFTGPIASSPAARGSLPDWWNDLDGRRPVVHVTQGTIANDDPGELILPTVRALEHEDVLVVVSTGGVPVDRLGALPANARAAEYLPYDLLMPRTDLFVTNGGYGGAQFALRHGVPLVVAPGKEDKVEVAARVAWSGAGRNLRAQRPKPGRLRSAILDVLADARYRRAAQRIAADIAAAPGVTGFVAAVEDAIARSPRAVGDPDAATAAE